MKISTRGRYALRMMLDLAEHQADGAVSLKDVAERQGISRKYLEQIVLLLNKEKMLQATRGFQGGYILAHEPKAYSVGSILRATEGTLAIVSCIESEINECEHCDACKTIGLWRGLTRVVNEYLDGITLQDLLDGNVG